MYYTKYSITIERSNYLQKALLEKNITSTRTRKFRVCNAKKINPMVPPAQYSCCRYFNYALKYLFQHFGSSHLKSPFPSGVKRKYLINRMVEFARKKMKQHGIDLKSKDFSMLAIDKMLEELCVNFIIYRKNQKKIRYYWSERGKRHYLRTHRCTLSGYGRINHKHHNSDIKSFTFKQNHNEIRLVDNYTLLIPYFGKIRTNQSLTYLKHEKIKEARIKIRRPGDYELQIVTKFKKQKHLTKKQGKHVIGLDVNSKDNKFFALSNKDVISWPQKVEDKYNYYDNKAKNLQKYLTGHNDGRDGSLKTRRTKKLLRKVKAKNSYMIDTWQMHVVHVFAKKYPIMAMEDLSSFTMRISKRDKRYRLRKNTNHKLATIHPTKFKYMMEYIYQDKGDLLLVVNPAYTSKTCHHDGYIYFKLGLQKKWTCKRCHRTILRDLNSTYNIRDWALHPREHALWRLHCKYPKKFPNVKLKDLVTAF